MSYDLIVSPAKLHPAALKLASRFGCEAYVHEDGLSISLPLLDDDVYKFYKGLVVLARKGDGGLRDPQAGVAIPLDHPGLYPPGWQPSKAGPGRSFKSKAVSFLRDYSRGYGFTPRSTWTTTRDTEDLRQGIYLQPGRGRRSGMFTVKVYWSGLGWMKEGRWVQRDEENEHGMSVVHQYGRFLSGDILSEIAPGGPLHSDADWLATSPTKKLEASFLAIQRRLDTRIMPLLDAIRTRATLVQVFESGALGVRDAFSSLEFLADCFVAVGRPEQGARYYEAYLTTLEACARPGLQEWLQAERERIPEVFVERRMFSPPEVV